MSALVDADPGRERAVRLLALARYRTGGQAEALATVRASKRYLADELGLDAGQELQALERDLLTGDVVAGAATPAAVPTGRPDELAALLDEADRALHGTRVVWLSGDAGAGKSHLLGAATAELSHRGWRVTRGNCPESDGAPPAWPWTELLRRAATAYGDLPANLEPLITSTSDPVDVFRLGHALGNFLAELAGPAPLLVVLDDLHRADELTLHLLRLVLEVLDDAPVLMITTHRTAASGTGLAAVQVAASGRDGRHLPLGPLTDDGVVAVLGACGVTGLPPAEFTVLCERSDRNPLYVTEFARLVTDEGAAALEHGLPAGIADLVRHRLRHLPDTTIQVLRAAAVIGRDADLDVLAGMYGTGPEHLLDALEPALAARVLTEPAPDRIRFTHSLVRDTLYEDQSRSRRVRLHAAALAAIANLRPHDVSALAHHAALSATPATAHIAVEHLVEAARRADAHGTYLDAAALWNSAVAAHEMSSRTTEAELCALLAAQTGALARSGDIVTARAARARAVDVARRHRDTDATIAALTAWAAPVTWTIRVEPGADRHILDPIESVLTTPGLGDRDRALLHVARAFELEGPDSAGALDSARQAWALARAGNDAAVRCRALNALGYLAYGPDPVGQRREIAADLLAEAAAAGDTAFQAQAHFQWFLAAAAETALDEAREHADLAVRYASGRQLTQLIGVLALFRSVMRLLAGDAAGALAGYDAITARLTAEGTASAQWIGTIGRIGAGVLRGDLAPLVAELTAVETARPHSVRFPLVLALLDAGDEDRARGLWEAHRPHPRDYYWLAMTTLQALAAARLGDIETARTCHDALQPFSGRIAGLDSGSFCAGPVDAALAETSELLGDDAAAARYRSAAGSLTAALERRLQDPAWASWC
ncbi:ATP-binding protein [Rhodococcus phenolicus]|uniref:ATP-binding protein n=1 Tax=Rhodococcus phenolicus TaxID=263849 RepID=UPI001FDFAF04|nr:AAA family ATPase [Rhodococcus phenolicus]